MDESQKLMGTLGRHNGDFDIPEAFLNEVCTLLASSISKSGLDANIAACFICQNPKFIIKFAASNTASLCASGLFPEKLKNNNFVKSYYYYVEFLDKSP